MSTVTNVAQVGNLDSNLVECDVQDITVVKKQNGVTTVIEAITGDIIIYEIEITNTGGSEITDLGVEDTLHPKLMYVEGSMELNGNPVKPIISHNSTDNTNLLIYVIDSIPPHSTSVLRFNAKLV